MACAPATFVSYPSGHAGDLSQAPAALHWHLHPLIPALERTRAGDSARVMVSRVCHCATPRRQQRWQLPCQSDLSIYFMTLEANPCALTNPGAPKRFVSGRRRGRLHGFCARRSKEHNKGGNCRYRDTLPGKLNPWDEVFEQQAGGSGWTGPTAAAMVCTHDRSQASG